MARNSRRGPAHIVASLLSFWFLVSALALAIGLAGHWAFGPPSRFEASVEHLRTRADRGLVEAISVGHSRGGVDFDALALRGHPLWIGGADIFESAEIVRALVDELPRLRVVLLTSDFLSFTVDHGAGLEASPTRIFVYGGLGPGSLIGADLENWLRARLRLVARIDGWTPLRRCVRDGFHDCRTVEPPLPAPPADPFANAEERVRLQLELRSPGVELSALRALRRLADDLQDLSVGLVLHSPPVSRAYLEALESQPGMTAARQRMERMLDEIDSEYPCVVRARQSFGPEFTANPQMFLDSDHLNEQGETIYSRTLSDSVDHLDRYCGNERPLQATPSEARDIDVASP